jgi:hypothetical protein
MRHLIQAHVYRLGLTGPSINDVIAPKLIFLLQVAMWNLPHNLGTMDILSSEKNGLGRPCRTIFWRVIRRGDID